MYGKSDRTTSEVVSDPVKPQDLLATVYHQLGIDSNKVLYAPGPRPIVIVKDGSVVKELLA